MLVIPLTGKLSRHNLPIATLIIILINVAIYFTVQSQDDYQYSEAQKLYVQSGLLDMEMKYYLAYRGGNNQAQGDAQILADDKTKDRYLMEMMGDDDFQRRLSGNKIVMPQDPLFEKWRQLRDAYDSAIGKVTSVKYGFIPEKHQPATVLSHMFLHGSFMHLLGNMVFLWLVGCVLELGFGKLNYIILYLLGGVFAVGLFYVFNMDSTAPLVGASGAISGLMGAYTVAYGRTKINVFYSLGFYFNYTKVYAIILLPLWLISEAMQLLFLKGSNVAYLVHIGGLIGGAGLGFLNIRFFRKENHKVFEENPKEKIKPLQEQALKKMETLDMAAARLLFTEVLSIDPANGDALKHLFNIDKLQPQSPEFHQTAAKRLTGLCRKKGSEKELTETFMDYYQLTGKLQLNPDLLLNISRAFAHLDKMDEAEGLIGRVFSSTPHHPRISSALMEMASIYHSKGRHDLRDHYLKFLSDRYPQSSEAAAIKNRSFSL